MESVGPGGGGKGTKTLTGSQGVLQITALITALSLQGAITGKPDRAPSPLHFVGVRLYPESIDLLMNSRQ